MSNKQILGSLGVLVVLAVVFGWLAMYTKPKAAMPTAGDKSPVLAGTLESSGDYRYKESGPGYSIEAVYPAKVPLATEDASKKAARALETKLADAINAFKTDATQMLTADEIARLEQAGASYAFGLEYTNYASSKYQSYVYQVYQDTGGAHPNAFYLTYVFDQEGNLVPLEQLFKDSSYLQKLSELAYPKVVAELSARVGEAPTTDMLDTVRVGTAPTPETLQFYYLTDTDLHLLFPPYQVAAYAAGSFDIAIPLTSLSSVLK